MKRKIFWRIVSLRVSLCLAALCAGAGSPALGQNDQPSGEGRKERSLFVKPEKTSIDPNVSVPDVIVVKFREGTGLRLRDDRWTAPSQARSPEDELLLQRANLDSAKVAGALDGANLLLQANSNVAVARLFTRPESELDLEKRIGEENSNEELADLNLYFHLFVDSGRVEDSEALIDQLNALDIVEIAYPQPIYQTAQAVTPDFSTQQGYLNVASTTAGSNGLDSRYAWTLPGGRGEAVRLIDIEFDWRDGHEDLPGLFYNSGIRDGVLASRNHGAAVLGVLAGVENGIGVTGMAPRLPVGISHPNRLVCVPLPCRTVFNTADAINQAAGQLRNGDIILIEVQVGGPVGTLTCNTSCGNCSQFGMIAVEYYQAEYDAIRNATVSSLIVVVEAAGNGQMNLDDARYNNLFNRSTRDSFAIMVGAGGSSSRSPWCWSDAGNRVDVQGWGDSVVSAGYGDLFGMTETRWYTSSFGGTSSGSAIISGAVANVQGVRRTRGLAHLSSIQMRQLLRQTGVAQASGRQIGPLPNLKEAIAVYIDGGTGVFFRMGIPDQPFLTIAEGINGAWNQAQLKITARNYNERLTITQPMFLMTRGGTVTIGQ